MDKREPGIVFLVILGAVLVSCGGGPGEKFPDQGFPHIEVTERFSGYNSVPPTSGPMWPAAGPWGIFYTSVPNEQQVHNLEHGGIMINYDKIDQAQINELVRFAQKQKSFPCSLTLAPYPGMPFKIAVTAWRVRDTMETFDGARLQEFVDAYKNKGPERLPCA